MLKSKKNEIRKITAKKILDSKGNPTIRVRLETNLGNFFSSVPSGTSKGKWEAVEKKAEVAVENVNRIIGPELKEKDPTQQKKIDELLIKLDGKKDKSRLGANAILGVSIAVLRAGAKAKKVPLWKWVSEVAEIQPSLPIPSVLLVEGGLHAKTGLDFQEFMAVFPGKSFKNRFKLTVITYNNLKKILNKKYGEKVINLGLEGAFTPPIRNIEDVLKILIEVDKTEKMKIIIDAAASTFYRKGRYCLEGKKMVGKELLDFYLNLCQKYPILAIEDPFSEEDWKNWRILKSKIKNQKPQTLLIGDDLTVTNPKRIRIAYQKKACNAVILKPNQIGTVSETIEAAKLAKSFGWKIIVSHRSGETTDDFISDLSVGLGADFIKSGAPFPKERLVKYNRLIEIEKEMRRF